MDNIIRYYYNIISDEFSIHDGNAIIKSNNETYIFKRMLTDEKNLIDILNLLNSKNIKYNHVLLNKDNNIYTKYENNNYCLIQINEKIKEMEFQIFNIILFNQKDITVDKWINRLEYYSKNVEELKIDNNDIDNLFAYFSGMAENAIQIYNKINKSNLRYTISHRRLSYPLLNTYFYDPTNMLIDNISRDITEYIKAKYQYDKVDSTELKNLILRYNLNNDELNALFARLLYPSFFFDEIDNMIKEKDYSNIKGIKLKINSYELLLKEIYKITDNSIYIIDWIKK